MRATLKVTKTDDSVLEVTAIVADFIAWERKTKRRTSDLTNGIGVEDLAYLAWHALNRTSPQPDFDAWTETIVELEMAAEPAPKAGRKAASTG